MNKLVDAHLPKAYEEKLEYVVTELIRNLKDDIKEISLFGSASRNELVSGSDIDILIIPKDDSKRKLLSLKIEYLDLREDIGLIPVDIIVRSTKYLNNREEQFARTLREQRKVLWYNV